MRMDRRAFLRSFSTGAGAAWMASRFPRWASAQARSDSPMNVLFIGADDLRCSLGCYGREHIHSPNIDALADRGVLFERAYVQQAVCAASRASFLTGCRPDTTGVDYPYSEAFKTEFIKVRPSLHKFFYDRGYYARAFGKIHHGWMDDLNLSEDFFGGGGAGGWRGYALPENRRKSSEGVPPPTEMADVPDIAYKDGRITQEVIATMRRADGRRQPFFLSVGYYKPHLPFTAPKRYWDLYDRGELPLSPNPAIPDGAPRHAPATFELPSYEHAMGSHENPIGEEEARLLRHAYFACVSFIDAQVGVVLGELDRLGLRENTIVVLWSDHGWHLGDNGCWGKHTNYERATRAPLIVSAPATRLGARSRALVEYVDIFPTLCELTGTPLPHYLEGTSMVPLLQDPDCAWKSAAFSQYPRGAGLEGYAIRTDRYRYVEWRKKDNGVPGDVVARELYDHRIDPIESVSLADNPDKSLLVEALSGRLRAGWRAAVPPR